MTMATRTASSTMYKTALAHDDIPLLWLQDNHYGVVADTIQKAMQQRYAMSEKSSNATPKVVTKRSPRRRRRIKKRNVSTKGNSKESTLRCRTSEEDDDALQWGALDRCEMEENGDISDADSIDLSKDRLSRKIHELEMAIGTM
eukprot:CAMPEP_0202453304 /NCGR_PEP_ID=MMETSP1360-20130828/11298_1 /ASSEMBLY_ACC=CAM_ASM_000848 /TAXON_ID=515479 /ORGANISM="Licmophora paradoxa, Strain CCMP2313" /LENGTH=143 /DNA_ID=CAMNT_0049072349 /DNA_START=39 /DNA_END=467 /DNA_ORIENTATION=+